MKRVSFLTLGLILSLLLFCSCGATPSFQVSDDDRIEVPYSVPYPLRQILDYSAWNSISFSTLPEKGHYFAFYFENLTEETVFVQLIRYEEGGAFYDHTAVAEMTVKGNERGSQVYETRDKEKATYALVINAIASGGAISGLVGLTQYQEPPDTVVLVPDQDVESTGGWRFPEGILAAPGRGSTLDLTYRNDTDAPATVTLHQGSGEDPGPALLTVEVPAGAEVTGQLALEDPTPGVREPFRVCVTPSAPDGAVDGRLSLIQRQETPA